MAAILSWTGTYLLIGPCSLLPTSRVLKPYDDDDDDDDDNDDDDDDDDYVDDDDDDDDDDSLFVDRYIRLIKGNGWAIWKK